MRGIPRSRHAPATMDVMRPSQLVIVSPAADVRDPRRWMRLVLLTLGGAAALLPLLGATTRALVD